MVTYIVYKILESNDFEDYRNALNPFLKREGIKGYTDDIVSIIVDSPNDDVVLDIIDSFNDDGIKIKESDVLSMDIKSMLERYLEWNGIKGYTEAIIRMSGIGQNEISKSKDLIKWRGKYFYRPDKGDYKVWTWDNEKLGGIPILTRISDIYDTPSYYGKSYYKDMEEIIDN